MKNKIFTLLGLLLMAINIQAQDPNFHIYLCFGQSNMEGTGEIQPQDQTGHNRFLVYQAVDCPRLDRKMGEWYTAVPPLSHCWSGLSVADYFGRTMAESLPEEVRIGVIVVAVGGCDIRLFDKKNYRNYDSTYSEKWFTDKIKAYDGNPYKHLMTLAKEAKKEGVIKGVLLHQGETNTGDSRWPYYVKKIYNDMLDDLSLEAQAVPLIAGEVVHRDQQGVCASMNSIINRLPKTVPTAHVVSSSGCTAASDRVHFDSAGYRELGKRYAQTMLELLEWEP